MLALLRHLTGPPILRPRGSGACRPPTGGCSPRARSGGPPPAAQWIPCPHCLAPVRAPSRMRCLLALHLRLLARLGSSLPPPPPPPPPRGPCWVPRSPSGVWASLSVWASRSPTSAPVPLPPGRLALACPCLAVLPRPAACGPALACAAPPGRLGRPRPPGPSRLCCRLPCHLHSGLSVATCSSPMFVSFLRHTGSPGAHGRVELWFMGWRRVGAKLGKLASQRGMG